MRFPKLRHKMWVSVAYNGLRYSETSHNKYKKQLHYLNCRQYLIIYLARNENFIFCELIYASENCVTLVRDK